MTITLEQIASLKLRVYRLPDELNVAREAAVRLGAEVKACKAACDEHDAEVAAFTRAAKRAEAAGKHPSETALTAAVKDALGTNETGHRLRDALRAVECRRDGAELTVKHLTDRFAGLQVYADLTSAEVRLLVHGLGA